MQEIVEALKEVHVLNERGRLIGGYNLRPVGTVCLISAMWSRKNSHAIVYRDIISKLKSLKIEHAFFYCKLAHYRLIRSDQDAHLIKQAKPEIFAEEEMMRVWLNLT